MKSSTTNTFLYIQIIAKLIITAPLIASLNSDAYEDADTHQQRPRVNSVIKLKNVGELRVFPHELGQARLKHGAAQLPLAHRLNITRNRFFFAE